MKWLRKILDRETVPQRLFVLGLDGLGLEQARGLAASGVMPNLAGLLNQGAATPLKPVLPAVSTVAWADYATGVNPGQHGIFGFVERNPKPLQAHFPTARDLKVPTLWEMLSSAGRRLGVINVPLTYPPKEVRGFMVGGFLSPELAGATFPVELAPKLMEMDYRIDADTSLAADAGEFLDELGTTMGRRFAAAFRLMAEEPWDFFQLHIMSTDRINHFFWGAEEDDPEGLGIAYQDFYRKLDSFIGELVGNLPRGCPLVLISDHGSEAAVHEVYLNHWLEKNGYLLLGKGQRELFNMHPESKAYSLAPGRVYLNVQGREEKGTVAKGREYEDIREELIHRLEGLVHPESSQPLVRRVHKREDLYSGAQMRRAADLILEPAPGCDIKSNLDGPGLVGPPHLPGMHSGEGGFLYIQGVKGFALEGGLPRLQDCVPTWLAMLGVAAPAHLEGRPLL